MVLELMCCSFWREGGSVLDNGNGDRPRPALTITRGDAPLARYHDVLPTAD